MEALLAAPVRLSSMVVPIMLDQQHRAVIDQKRCFLLLALKLESQPGC